ncbi:peptidoglycan endopeptidase [Dysgonomonas sp. 216]|uniref:C40 family peptidase n=1 Tax=Dysgonomonas sp. 216 TaxID=2302934 RepID=UPI0013D8AA10|nr:C40 family peptidase [Dysgonomonas sp. 216]NDW18358.1 peptidoglycan endopeptidase [Dysgonomonas sp. 216]NDW18726.1 peptidoglycan endopeptidase [Dysgonomonas sp. 216]
MKSYLLFVAITGLTLSGCKSKEQTCRCSYRSEININENFDSVSIGESCYSPFLDATEVLEELVLNIPEAPELIYTPPTYNQLSQDVLSKAFEYKGVRYRTGGTSLNGMDCSGLVYTCYKAFGVALPRTSIEMSKTVTEITRHEARPGDLVFFCTNKKHQRINHVGLVVEAKGREITFIHASIKGGVKISSTSKEFYNRTLAKIGRVLEA